MEIKTIGLDLSKSVFQAHGIDASAQPLQDILAAFAIRRREEGEAIIANLGGDAVLRED